MVFFYRLYSLFFPSNSLRAITWKYIKDNIPDLYKFRESLLKRAFRRFLNNNKLAFVFSILLPLFISPICFYLPEISFINSLASLIEDADSSKEILKNNLSNAATLIGISFVVLGFIFELVKDKTHQTFQELSSIVRLYPAMGFSFGIILFHIIVNQAANYIKSDETVGKLYLNSFSLYSSFLMVVLLLTLIFVFWKLFSYFSVEAINLLSRHNLLTEAKRDILQERFRMLSGVLYEKEMKETGLKKGTFHFNENLPPYYVITLPDTNKIFYDVRMKALKNTLSDPLTNIVAEDVFEFEPIHLDKTVVEHQKLFSVPDRNYFHMSNFTLSHSHILSSSSPSISNFNSQRTNLISRFHQTIKQGNNPQMLEVLKSMEELFKIYYQSKAR